MEQRIYDPAIVGAAGVVEQTVAEAAAHNRTLGGSAASVTAGDLVHVPFYEVQARMGTERLPVSVEA